MYSNKKGAEFCVRCTVGEYSDTTGATKCKLCKKGSIGVKHGASSSDDGCKQCDAGQGQQQPRLPTTPTNFYLSIQFGLRFGIKKLAFSPSLNPHPLGDSVSIQQNCSMKRDEGNAVVAHFGATANHRGDTRLVALWTTFSGIDIVSTDIESFVQQDIIPECE